MSRVFLQWTFDGKAVGDLIEGPRGVNDVHVRFPKDGPVEAWWSRDGNREADIPAPRDVNDVHIRWEP